MIEGKKAAFSFESFKVSNFTFNESETNDVSLTLMFNPSGKHFVSKGIFEIILDFEAIDSETKHKIITSTFVGKFSFESLESFDLVLPYFYKNSLGIMFPFIRAFVSTLTLQTNTGVLLLDIMNISHLEETFKSNTVTIEE
jgi:preprotein translocase subunit SecB